MQQSNYLFFATGCEQALAFYTECGLGKVVEVMYHGAGREANKTPETKKPP